jgi:activator of HSP90 ATPase
MAIEFTISDVMPATPSEIYDAWLSSAGHSAMTGSPAHASAEVGAAFDAWDGYINGSNLALEPGKRIVQSWRTSQFEDEHADSRIELTLEPVEGGTRVTLTHSNVPDGQGHYEQGWQSHYFEPMKAYFGR